MDLELFLDRSCTSSESAQDRSRIDPELIQDGSRIVFRLILDKFRIGAKSVQDRSRIDPGLAQDRSRIRWMTARTEFRTLFCRICVRQSGRSINGGLPVLRASKRSESNIGTIRMSLSHEPVRPGLPAVIDEPNIISRFVEGNLQTPPADASRDQGWTKVRLKRTFLGYRGGAGLVS